MVRGSPGLVSPWIPWAGCQGYAEPARETTRAGPGARGLCYLCPALRGRPGLRSWTTAQAGQGEDERSHAGGGGCAVVPGEPGVGAGVRGGPWGAWWGCWMRVWRFHLDAEFLSPDTVGAWGGDTSPLWGLSC